ncbi:MAG: hypothetical protein NTW30_04920 [Candidatus Aenigmarchaeota archaeon]|nr:hypothetical protein [Candidatus Aenigmarchaeota archaeon]
MKYSIISSIEYGKGRILLMSCRFNSLFTNTPIDLNFSRRILEWAASGNSLSMVSVGSVVTGPVDGGIINLNSIDMVDVESLQLDNLSVYSNFQDKSVIVIFGVDNDLSPLIRENLLNYVENGGGLILSDINVNNENIELLDNVSPVLCSSAGFNIYGGNTLWTDEGKAHYLYANGVFGGMLISPLNTVSLSEIGTGWENLYIYDADVLDPVFHGIDEDVIDTVNSSSDYDIPGVNIVGYFASVYNNGFFEIKK